MGSQVAANVALRDYPETIRQIMIVDLDVHQGNGNARLFADKPSVFTFSVHCRENYFSKVEVRCLAKGQREATVVSGEREMRMDETCARMVAFDDVKRVRYRGTRIT